MEWLKDSAVNISIDTLNNNFSDLQSLKNKIGNARIILLGEESHGDGTTFITKTRLIKFLHEQMGFNVLAFESNLYNAERAWSDVRNNINPMIALQNSTFPIWGNVKEVQPLFNYILAESKSSNSLSITAFDCQPGGFYFNRYLPYDFLSYLRFKEIDFQDSSERDNFYRFSNALINGITYQLKGKSGEEQKLIIDSFRTRKFYF